MSDFKNAISRLQKFSRVIDKAIISSAIIEAVLVIIIGIISNNLNTDDQVINRICIWLLVFFAGLYIAFLVLKTMLSKSYPGSIISELKSERELTSLKEDFERQTTINGFFVTSVGRLNDQTCALNYGDGTHLCDKGIKDGIFTLIEPLIDNAFFVLDTVNTKFTVGVFLESYRSMIQNNSWESGIITINDRLRKEHLLQKDLLTLSNVSGEQFHLQTALRKAFNNYEFEVYNYSVEAEKYTIVCSPIPLACDENQASGVLFIIGKQLEKIPLETETNLKIFDRVIANWVYRYNECVRNRQQLNTNLAVPQEGTPGNITPV